MKRKKQRRLLLILFLIFLVIFAGYFFLLRYNKKQEAKESQEEDTTVALYPKNFNSKSITGIQYDYEGETLSFSLKNDTWQYDKNTGFPLNQSSLTGMNSQLTGLTASRKVQDNLDQAADFGLDSPASYVTIKDSDGQKFTLYFGNTNDSADVTYVSTSEKDGIYTVASDLSDYFSHSLLDMIEADEIPQPDSTAIFQNVTIQKGDRTTRLVYKKDGDTSIDYTGQCNWFGAIGEDSFAADESSVSTLTQAFRSLSTSGCAAYDASDTELAAYGLDQPTAVIQTVYTQEEADEDTATASTGSLENQDDTTAAEETRSQTKTVKHRLTLKVGKKTGDYYYVTWDTIKQVYLMEASSLDPFLSCDKASLAYKKALNFSFDSLNSMEIKYQDLTFDYTIDRKEEAVSAENTSESAKEDTEASTASDASTAAQTQTVTTCKLNGEEIDSSDLTSLLTRLQDMTAEDFYPQEEGNAPIGDEAITITFHTTLKNRKKVQVILTPFDNNYYALYVDGTPLYLMNKTDISGLIEKLPTP